MPWWKKSSVSSWSAAVKWMRLGSPVVPDVGRVTILSTSPGGTQSKRMPCAAHVVGGREREPGEVVQGARARPARRPGSRSA